jgi:hypothetical protein
MSLAHLNQLMKCTLLFTEQVAHNVLANTTTVWRAFLLDGMKANGYSDQQAVAANCAGSQTQWAHVIVIALQAQSPYCFSALRHRCNASLHEYRQLGATA